MSGEIVTTANNVREAQVRVWGIPAWKWTLERLEVRRHDDGGLYGGTEVLAKGWYPRLPWSPRPTFLLKKRGWL